MWDINNVNDRLRKEGLPGRSWGYRGVEAVERIERSVGVSLGPELRDFVSGVGNLMVAPFEIVLGGDEAGKYSAATQTRALWNFRPALEGLRAIQLMDYAGQVYLYFPQSGRVCAYDSLRPVPGEETLSWESFDQFIEWIFDEAKAIARDSGKPS